MAFNIMVVDDSVTMRAVIKKTVSMCGVQIGELLEAGNGVEALEVLEDAWVDVILSDINMPEMDGLEFVRRLKKDEVLQNIPVVFVTTESSANRRQEAEEIGAAAYVTKPFMPEQIHDVLLDVLQKAYATRMESEMAEDGGDDDDLDF